MLSLKRLAYFAPLPFIIAIGATLAGWSPAWNKVPQIPTAGLSSPGVGRCVALYEFGESEPVGITVSDRENMHKADENRAAYAIGTYTAVALIAQKAGRPDLGSLALELRMTDGPNPSQEGGTVECWCSNTIWSGDPRKGGKVTGCGGPCGSCTHCTVRSPAIN